MVRHKLVRLVVACTVGILVPRAALASSILLNGDFQTGTLANWASFTTASGTNGAGLPDVIAFDTTGSGASFAAHFDVGESVFGSGQQGGGISQNFVAAVGGLYQFSADIASQDDITNAGPNSDAGTFTILIDGVAQASSNLGAFAFQHQIKRGTLSGSIALGVGAHSFALQITRGFISNGDNTPTQYLDNIVLEAPGATVPEPGSLLLIGTGLLGVTRWRRRTSSNVQ